MDATSMSSLSSLPMDLIFEIVSHLDLNSLAQLQRTSSFFYNLILQDRAFIYYNTVKFFELYYRRRLFALFLFPYIDIRYSYYGKSKEPTDPDTCPGNTSFHIAAANGLLDVCRELMEREQNGELLSSRMNNHLGLRGSKFNEEAATYIRLKVENQWPTKLVDLINEEPNSTLHYISILPESVNETDILHLSRLLIRRGRADLTRRGRVGNTVLCEAAQHGQLEMVRLILDEYERRLAEQSAGLMDMNENPLMPLTDYINMYNDYSENAVILAARSHPEVLRLLLERGASPNAMRRGSSILHIVCSQFQLDRRDPDYLEEYHQIRTLNWQQRIHRSITETLADEKEDEINVDPLVKSLRYLIQFGADLHQPQQGTGMKPLHTAAFWGSTVAIEILVQEAGVDPNTEFNERNRWLPIHYACSEGQIFSIQTLLTLGARIWDKDSADDDGEGTDDEDVMETVELMPRIPAPMELLSFDFLKTKIRGFAKRQNALSNGEEATSSTRNDEGNHINHRRARSDTSATLNSRRSRTNNQ